MVNYPTMSNMYPNVNVSPAMHLPNVSPAMQMPNANIPPMGAAFQPTHHKPMKHMPTYVSPAYTAPTYVSPAYTAPMHTCPIHLSHYEQINVYPPMPKKHAPVCADYTSLGIILVLYILLVIILRGVC